MAGIVHIHILGICGTFMGGLALLARAAGHQVSGSDAHVYPPMSTQLEASGIRLSEGFEPEHLSPRPDCVVVGNVMSRGREIIEYILNEDIPYSSGPQWLSEHILRDRWVLAVAGTHGKTTAASMLAWILEYAGMGPGYLIGGVPENFGVSARMGEGPFFVVEADEYDTAFFDKRSKFVHYRPRTLALNNLEFDHADIFPDLDAIKRQFHHLIRTVPGNGLIVTNADDGNLEQVLEMGCWTPVERFTTASAGGARWRVRPGARDFGDFEVIVDDQTVGRVRWTLAGVHNAANALAALAAARHAGVPVAHGIEALSEFRNVKRRLELRATVEGISVYDDFAHHPTAIRLTVEALRARVGDGRIVAVLEPRSNTMRMGVHRDTLADSLVQADEVVLYQAPELSWSLSPVADRLGADRAHVLDSLEAIVDDVGGRVRRGDSVLIMSNGAFGGLHERLIERLQARW